MLPSSVAAAASATGGATQLAASSARTNPLPAQAVSLDTSVNMADQAAISWVQTNAPGTGTAQVLNTEFDTEVRQKIPVYDIKILVPKSVIFVVQIKKPDFSLLTVNIAENQPYLSTTTTTSPPSTTTTTTPEVSPATAAKQPLHG